MDHEEKSSEGSALSVHLPIPTPDSSLFGPGSIGDVLEFLARNRFEEFAQSEVAACVDGSRSTVRRAIESLAANGLVEYEYDGTRKLVRINQSRLCVPNDPILQIPQEEYREPVKAAVGRLQNELDDVVGVALYGSVARGVADRRSDVDLWVAVRGDRAEQQRIANEIATNLGEVRFDGDRYEFHVAVESMESIPSFTDDVGDILQSGVPVYDTEEFRKLRALLVHDRL